MPHPKSIILFAASRTWGGGEEYLYRLAIALRDRGYSVSFVLQPRSKEILVSRYSEIGDTLTLKPRFSKFLPLMNAWRLLKFIRSHNASVVHVNARGDYFVAVWAKLLSDVPLKIVATNHLVKRAKSTPLYRWAYSHVDTLINVSDCARKEFLSIPDVNNIFRNVLVIKNSVPDFSYLKKDNNLSDEVKVLYHGRIHPEKGILQLIDHWHEVIATLYIAGTGLPVPEKARVVNLGFQPNVREMIADYDISVSPSVVPESGGPLSLIEAMAAGVPVVASSNGCQSEYVRDGIDGILCPAGDWSSFVAAINRLAADRRLRQEMGSNARKQYETELSFDKFVDAVEKVYESL